MTENSEWVDGTDCECIEHGVRHRWVLISEERLRDPEDEQDDGPPVFRRRWYCMRCRLVEQWTSV